MTTTTSTQRAQKFAVSAPFSDNSDSEQEGSSGQECGQGYETEPEEGLNPEEARETLQHEQLLKTGYLYKKQERRNVRRKHWKRRWFVLRSTKLAYYKDEKEYELLRIFDMNDVHAIAEVELKSKNNVFGIVTQKRTYYIHASSKKELDEWVDVLNEIKNQVQCDDEDEGSQADSEEMASKQARIASPKKPPKLVFRESLEVKTPVRSPSLLDKPLVTSPVNTTPAIDIPKPSVPQNKRGSGEGVSSYTSGQSTPSSPSGNFPPERKDSSDPTASSEDDDGVFVESTDVQISPEEDENNRTIHSGYLYKMGNRYKTWKLRWFVLRANSLSYYKNEKEREVLKVIPLTIILDAIEIDPVSKSKQHCFKIITPKRTFVVCARDDEAAISWLGTLQMALSKSKEKLKEAAGKSTTVSLKP